MSNQIDSQASPESPAPEARAKRKTNPTRLIILLAVLGLVSIGLAYDRLVAKPQYEAAVETLEELVDIKNRRSIDDDPITPVEVQAALNRNPSTVEEANHYLKETYVWRRGSVLQRYFIDVVYLPSDPPMLHTFFGNDKPSEAQLPGGSYIPPREEGDEQATPPGAAEPSTPPRNGTDSDVAVEADDAVDAPEAALTEDEDDPSAAETETEGADR